jgi:hypothetical protein
MTRTITTKTTPASSQISDELPLIAKVSRLFGGRITAMDKGIDHESAPAAGSDSPHTATAGSPNLTMRWASEGGRLQAAWAAAARESTEVCECQSEERPTIQTEYGEISMPRNRLVIDLSSKTGNGSQTAIGNSLHSFAGFSIKSLLFSAVFLVLFLQAKAQLQGWQHNGASSVSVEEVFVP